eukprot:TRINITY_DN20829_c0_g1_i1.p1 TRINITY_DN20829_c0_g1~~TRINITY_DN20829_c0_g1_i1.p1  ORF type:complete len:364 (-),score=76.76 TRINITY_DN20829_c0_g1_i1:220-1311(-)
MGVKVDQEALVGLLMHALPRVADHFREIRFDIRALVPAWLMSLFVNTFPIETVLRIWDCIITENHTHYTAIPLSILIAFMKVHQEEILKCEDAGELMVFLNRSSTQEYDAQRLIKTAMDLGIKHSELHHIRRKVRETILVDAERRKKARADMLEQRRLQKVSAEAATATSSSDQQSVESGAMGSSTPLGASGVGPSFDESGAVAAFTLREQKEKEERNQRLREISPNYYQNSQKAYQPGAASSSLEGGRNGTSAVPPPIPQGRRVPAVQEMEEFSRCDGEDSETVSRLTTEANKVAMRTSVVVAKGPASPVAPAHQHAGKPRQAESVDGSSGRESPTNSHDESTGTPTTATNSLVVGEDTIPF